MACKIALDRCNEQLRRLRWSWHFHLLRRRARSLAARVVTMIHPWIHTPGDGRGQRQVYLDGEPVYMCVYANTRTGVIRAYHDPVKVCPRREVVRSYKRRGNVRVEAMG